MTVQDIDNAFRKKAESNVQLYALRKKIEGGTATFADTAKYSDIICNLLGKTLGENIEKIPESERAKFCTWLLRNQYTDTMEMCRTVQRFLDEKNGINLAPQIPAFPKERAEQVAQSLEDQTVPAETIRRRAEAPVANVAKSFHDSYIRKNADFRSRAGLKCYITREGAGCCPWCAEMVGRYVYGDEPHDVYRRHDNCSCTVIYENGRERQDVWSKRTWEVPDKDAGAPEPTVFTPETAPVGFVPTVLFKAEKMAATGSQPIDAKPIRHTVDELKELANYARSRGINYHNPMQFDGDLSLMRRQIDMIAALREEFHITSRMTIQTLTSLGEDVAETAGDGGTIRFNAVFLRSEQKTNEYLNADNVLSSANAVGISAHEMGHVIARKYGEIGLDIARKTCYNISGEEYDLLQTLEYLAENLSEYSASRGKSKDGKPIKEKHFKEIIPEVLGRHYTSPNDFTTEFIRLLKEAYKL